MRARTAAAASLLVAIGLAFWKLRILDSGVDPALSINGGDLYFQHWPMTEYGFGALRSGRLPLWNPYQLCGTPFLALPYVGLFYPLNAVYLLFSTPVATEWEAVLHTLIGLVGMWALLRHYGSSHLAALTAAVTFAWSGWLVYNVNQPALFACLNWMPLTVLGLDAVAAGTALAWLGLSVLVALQLLRGGAEVLAHALVAAGIFGAARLVIVARGEGVAVAVRRAALVAGAVAAGFGLAAVQLFPTFELVQNSVRAAGGMSYNVARIGYLDLSEVLRGAVAGGELAPLVVLGMWPLLAVALAAGTRRARAAWICALALTLLALALVPGGTAFRIYFSLPLVGSLFRRPSKFLDMYALGMAILAGLAVDRLRDWRDRSPLDIARHPAWLAAVLFGLALLAWWPWSSPLPPASLGVFLLLLLAFALVPSPRGRLALLAVLCAAHGAALFFSVANTQMRPLRRPDALTSVGSTLRPLIDSIGYDRAYLFGDFAAPVGWQAKQGMLNRFSVNQDYEALLPVRYETFFQRVTPMFSMTGARFSGIYAFTKESQPRLLAFASTSRFATLRGTLSDAMAQRGGEPGAPSLHLVADGPVRLYATDGALPRAYFVGGARVVPHEGAILRMMTNPRFNPLAEVLLGPESQDAGARPGSPVSSVAITSYEPERVVVDVSADAPGYLVLTDLLYPGWQAFADGAEVPIQRANFLFRAVRLGAGRHEVRFEYHPASLRLGLAVSVATALLLAAAVVVSRRRWR